MKFILFLLCLNCLNLNSYVANTTGKKTAKKPDIGEQKQQSFSSSLLPVPQHITLTGKTYRLTGQWAIEWGENISDSSSAVKSLRWRFQKRFHIKLKTGKASAATKNIIYLEIHPHSVAIAQVTDTNRAALKKQAYQLHLDASKITITANASAGLFYGVQTLVQLLKKKGRGDALFPEGKITDWPDLERRIIFWDDSHHLDRFATLKRMIRRAAYYKINGIALKLNGHFKFKSAPYLVAPQALSAGQYQKLTDYALARHIQLIPYVDAPAHDTWILKHPEYAHLRAFPHSNYEFCVSNPETYRLLSGMLDDLTEANKGSKFLLLSTDESYYIGMADNYQCEEKELADSLGTRGKLLAEFLSKLLDKYHKQGRQIIFWGEYPLKPSDVKSLPKYLINGEVNKLNWSHGFDKSYEPTYYDTVQTGSPNIWKSHGMRQFIYTSTQGVEPLFPNYYPVHSNRAGRVKRVLTTISKNKKNNNADFMGTTVAAWGDSGLHPETF